MNKTTRAITLEELRTVLTTMNDGFTYNNVNYRSNDRIASILLLQANIGLRIGDMLNLRRIDIIREQERYRLNIIEQKTGKNRYFTVPIEIYNFIMSYCSRHNISKTARIFQITERAIQKHLKNTCDYLGIGGISTHSFRKFFATSIYINNDHNIILVQRLLQHSNVNTTNKYINYGDKILENAINKHLYLMG